MNKAKFERLKNDLFWTFYDWNDDGKKYTWQGYDDRYWWTFVSLSDTFQIRGKYRLNPETNEVIKVNDG